MVRDKRFLKFGVALALSLGGLLFSFLRNKGIKPSQSPQDPPNSSDSGRESWASKSDQHVLHTTQGSCHFDSLATDKHEDLHHSNDSIRDLCPSSKSNGDKDAYLHPEFNDFVEQFDFNAMEDTELSLSDSSHEQEIKNLRNMVKILKERERSLEIELLEYYGLKEQETSVMELQNCLKLKKMEAKHLDLKIKSLQADNRRLEAQTTDYSKVVADLEGARAKIELLKKKLRTEAEQNKKQILDLQLRVEKMQEEEHNGVVRIDAEIRSNLHKYMDLVAEVKKLRKSNYNLQLEKSDLTQRLDRVQILATSVLEDEQAENLKEESQHLRKQNEDLSKEIERIQLDRCTDVEELVYLRWINACLRYELRNYQPLHGKTIARDLSKTLTPKSEEKAKQLILEYANKEGVVVNMPEFDSDQWSSSPASFLTDSGECEESLIQDSSPRMILMDSKRSKYRHSDVGGSGCIYKRIGSIAEDGQRSKLMKYAEVLNISHGKSSKKFRGRSSSFSSFR